MNFSRENDKNTTEILETKRELYLWKEQETREKMKSDKNKVSDETYCCVCVLQKALPFPKFYTFIAYN